MLGMRRQNEGEAWTQVAKGQQEVSDGVMLFGGVACHSG